MKRCVYIIILLFLVISSVEAQFLPGGKTEEQKKESKKKGVAGSFMLDAGIKAANMLDTYGVELGFSAGQMLSERFGLGFGFAYLISENVRLPGDHNVSMALSHFGVKLYGRQPIIKNSLQLFAEFTASLGQIDTKGSYANYGVAWSGEWIFLLDPAVGIDIGLGKGNWISLAMGYRQALGTGDYFNMKDSDLSGLEFSLRYRSL